MTLPLPVPRAPKSLAGRLLLGAAVFMSAALLVAGLTIGLVLHRFIRGQIDSRLDTQILTIEAALDAGPGGLRVIRSVDGPPFDRPGSGWYWRVTAPGLLARSASLGGDMLVQPERGEPRRDRRTHAPPDGGPPAREPPPRGLEGRGPDGEPLHVRRRRTVVEGMPALIEAAAPQAAIADPTREALLPVLACLAAMVLALGAATLLQVRLGLRPVQRMRDAIAAVRAGHADRVPQDQPLELRSFAGELNTLLRQNAEGLDRARRHVSNLAHGLKTPLATMTVRLGQAERDPDGDLRALCEDMHRRIRHHLARARAAALAGAPARARTEVTPRIDDIAAALDRIYRERGIRFERRALVTAAVACEAQDVDEMLGNLLDNAFKWARNAVVAEVVIVGRMTIVTVADDGPGLAGERLPDALLPGRRLDENAPGDGFGLSIVRELAELYGGGIALGRAPQGGLLATLTLPSA